MTRVGLGMPGRRHHARPGQTTPEQSQRAQPRPDDARLVDTFGRIATDLRVSLTDRCNLRCTYCMPAEGLDWLPGEQLLTDDELNRLIRIAVCDLGVDEVRF